MSKRRQRGEVVELLVPIDGPDYHREEVPRFPALAGQRVALLDAAGEGPEKCLLGCGDPDCRAWGVAFLCGGPHSTQRLKGAVSECQVKDFALKPWPADAVMIVCSVWGEENRAAMEAVTASVCRECRQSVAADTKSVRAAVALPERRGRPVKFFCLGCHKLHATPPRVIDHAGVTTGRYRSIHPPARP